MPNMMTPLVPKMVCATCMIPMVIDTIGINVAEVSDGQPPRIIYKTAADKYICPSCGFTILSGFPQQTVTSKHGLDFINMPVSFTMYSQNHSMTPAEIESILSELRMRVYAFEMKRDNLAVYKRSQEKRKK